MLATAKRGIDGNPFGWQLFLIWQVLQDSPMLQIYVFLVTLIGRSPDARQWGWPLQGGGRGEHWVATGEQWQLLPLEAAANTAAVLHCHQGRHSHRCTMTAISKMILNYKGK